MVMRHAKVELSESQEAQLSERLAAGEFADFDAYVAALIDAETRLRAQERLEELLLEGVRSPSVAWTPQVMDEIRRGAQLKR